MRIDTDRLGDEIAELAAHLDAATHRLLALIRRFDESAGWADQGALSCAHWLCWRIGLELGAAREHVRVARALADLPLVDEALRRGQVSYSKVRALTRVATPGTEEKLLEMARSATASQLERICRGFRRAMRNAAGDRPEDEAARRWVRERETEDGLVRFEIQLRPEEAAAVRAAIEAAMRRAYDASDVSAGTPPASLRRADALVAVAEQYLAGGATAPAMPPVEVVVHVEAATLAMPEASGTLDDGTPLSPAATERLLCDAAVVEFVEDSRGKVLDVGRSRRTIPAVLRRALRLRDRGCRFPGCTNRMVDGHHVLPWVRGGATSLANLCSLCRRHHTHVHEYGFRMEADGEGGFRFFRPDGTEIPAASAPSPPPADAVEQIRAMHQADGIAIGPLTAYPRWDGMPADYDQAVSCLFEGEGRAP